MKFSLKNFIKYVKLKKLEKRIESSGNDISESIKQFEPDISVHYYGSLFFVPCEYSTLRKKRANLINQYRAIVEQSSESLLELEED